MECCIGKTKEIVGWVEEVVYVQRCSSYLLISCLFLPFLLIMTNMIERIIHNFLSEGSGGEDGEFNLVSREKVCYPIKYTGLGVQKVTAFNHTI